MFTFLIPALLGFAIHAPRTHAIPAPTSAPRSSSVISSQCINHEYRDQWFIADCLTGEDATTRIQSAVWLDNKVANVDGDLKWDSGGLFHLSCNSCKIIDAGATLTCSCGTTWQSSKNVSVWDGKLSLDEHISVYSGQLLSNFPKPPTVPSAPRKAPTQYPLPSSFKYSFGGSTFCPDASTGTSGDYCNTWMGNCTTSQAPGWEFQGPLTCYVPVIYFPDIHYTFDDIKLEGEGAWEILAYSDEKCAGEIVATVGPEDKHTCRKFASRVKAVTIRPLFYGDPN